MYRSPPILAVQGEGKKLLAGQTDRYVIARHRELVGPVELPEGF